MFEEAFKKVKDLFNLNAKIDIPDVATWLRTWLHSSFELLKLFLVYQIAAPTASIDNEGFLRQVFAIQPTVRQCQRFFSIGV